VAERVALKALGARAVRAPLLVRLALFALARETDVAVDDDAFGRLLARRALWFVGCRQVRSPYFRSLRVELYRGSVCPDVPLREGA
jgi:hypothetical protein